jgi:hypothetical protein
VNWREEKRSEEENEDMEMKRVKGKKEREKERRKEGGGQIIARANPDSESAPSPPCTPTGPFASTR